jgi:hypothetical protein
MGSYQVAAFFHLVLAALVTGYALFWAIMGLSLSTRFGPKEVLGHLDTVKATRWPHVIVPWKLRLPLPLMGWLLLGAAAVSGLATGHLGTGIAGLTPLYVAKLLLFMGLLAGHARLARRPTPAAGYLAFVLVVLILVASTLMIR